MKKSGFTLPELLITLGLLGVIGALTIPNLAYNYRAKVLEEQFRSTYSDIKQAVSMITKDRGDFGTFAIISSSEIWQNEFMQKFSGASLTNVLNNITSLKNYYKSADSKQGPLKFNGDAVTNSDYVCFDPTNREKIWVDSKGRLWGFSASSAGKLKFICVDVNGTANPNKYNIDIYAYVAIPPNLVARLNGDSSNISDYPGEIKLCDISKLKLSDTYRSATPDDNELDGVIEFLNTSCSYTEPIEDIAVVDPETGVGTSSKGNEVTRENSYWKDYIDFKDD